MQIEEENFFLDGIAYFVQEMMTSLTASKGFALSLKHAFC